MYLRQSADLSPQQEAIVSSCLDCGMAVHRVLGPGYKECIYCRAFQLELDSRGIRFEAEKSVTVRYKQWDLVGQRIDLIVEGTVIVEIKSVDRLQPVYVSQIVSYLRATNLRVGLLMNFNETRLENGLRRVVL
jgi:GxxExxY protein